MRIIAFLIEIIGWIKIVASPLIIDSFIGGLIYLKWNNDAGLAAGIIVAGIGLLGGITWATTVWYKHGTMNYLSKLNATPDLDKLKKDH
ncbi:MAG: hypothetical protein V4590_09885 [Bacteroidota bacterium]